jgi:hypothetical protein
MSFSIACADVGSISAGNFGWAICDPPAELAIAPGHTSIDALAEGRPGVLRYWLQLVPADN